MKGVSDMRTLLSRASADGIEAPKIKFDADACARLGLLHRCHF